MAHTHHQAHDHAVSDHDESHAHAHDVDHHRHHRDHKAGGDRMLLWALLLIASFAIVEALGGWFTGSLALLGDAGHMISDAAALGLAWLGSWIARKPASQRHSYGLVRAEVMVALINGLLMLAVVIAIVVEALHRLEHPQAVQGIEVMLIAALGLIVNIVVARQLHQHQDSLNHRAALLHVLGDLLGSIAALAAGAVIYFTGWLAIDPILSLFICALILISTLRLLREVLHVLMEGVPHHINMGEVSAAIISVPQVQALHSVHIWALSSEVTALSAHVVVEDMQHWQQVLTACGHVLHSRFGIDHITLQPELAGAHAHGGHLHDEPTCWLTQPASAQQADMPVTHQSSHKPGAHKH
ncbi:cation diffusion facilitator family transporter [Methylobacillus flagellatus]|uniref:cation diffusion facilitator family transporter n=1 Tax=Methylobacillus flagellatus TaxID=405 RepID=UPI0010F445B0|nr:cation diffusion facilitator family transporter [Methylobacillus flagellatus]